MTVGDKSEISCPIPEGTLPWQPIFVLVHGCRCAQVASGAAGRANVGFALQLVHNNFASSIHVMCTRLNASDRSRSPTYCESVKLPLFLVAV